MCLNYQRASPDQSGRALHPPKDRSVSRVRIVRKKRRTARSGGKEQILKKINFQGIQKPAKEAGNTYPTSLANSLHTESIINQFCPLSRYVHVS